MVCWILGEVRNGSGTLGAVRVGSEDPRGGPGWVGEPSGRFGTVRWTLGQVQDGSGDPWVGPGRLGDTL